MTDEDARYYAKSLTDIQRRIIVLCSNKETYGYLRLAEKTGTTYADAQQVGWYLQSANLAEIKLLKPGFNGSGIFLNERGEQVKLAVLRMKK